MTREPYAETRARQRTPVPERLAPFARQLAGRLPVLTHKEDAPCCVTARDGDGRLPIGFCGPNCLRREERDQRSRLR